MHLTGPRWCIPGDPRITHASAYLLRRTHIDELPQLLNVLLGHMSLIGPRSERPEFVVQLERAIPGYIAGRGVRRHHRPGPGAVAAQYRGGRRTRKGRPMTFTTSVMPGCGSTCASLAPR
ncbi:MAG: sugar transferase [Gemmataceae bacterium]